MTQIGFARALNAYQAATDRTLGNDEKGGMNPAPAFGALLKGELVGGVDALRQGEAASLQNLAGQANTQALVEAVTAAEMSLEKVTAIRDRVLSAYQEIIRMPI